MRLVHVLHPWSDHEHAVPREGGSDAAAILCREAIRVMSDHRHEVIVIGGTAEAARLRSLGLVATDRIAPPLRSLRLARRAFAKFVAARADADVILAWDVDVPTLLGPRWRGPRVVPVRLSQEAAVGDGSIPVPTCDGADREAVRSALGLLSGEFAVGLIADPPTRGDATRLVFLLSMMHIIGVPVVGVMSNVSVGVRRALSDVRQAYLARLPILTDMPVAAFLPACEAGVLALGSRFGGEASPPNESERMLTALALQAGVPVLTWDQRVLPVALRATCRTRSGHPGHISNDLLRWSEDRAHLERVRTLCREHAPGDSEAFASRLRAMVERGAKVGAAV